MGLSFEFWTLNCLEYGRLVFKCVLKKLALRIWIKGHWNTKIMSIVKIPLYVLFRRAAFLRMIMISHCLHFFSGQAKAWGDGVPAEQYESKQQHEAGHRHRRLVSGILQDRAHDGHCSGNQLACLIVFPVQWGSEIQTSLDFKCSKRSRVANDLDFKWDLKSRSPTIRNLDKWLPFCQKPFEVRTKMFEFGMLQFSNGWDSSYSHS